MVPAGNKANRLSSVNHTAKTIHHHHHLILLSGNVSLDPGRSQYLQDKDNAFKPFYKGGLHFLHFNLNSLLLKIDKLRDIVGHTKPTILAINESKLDSSVADQEVIVLWLIQIEMLEVLLAASRLIFVLIAEIHSQI